MKKLTAAQKRFIENATLYTASYLIFNELFKNDFPKKELSELADTGSGGTPNRGNLNYYDGEIPWIKSGELNDGFILEAKEFISEEGLLNSSARIFPKGSVVVALYGATVGKTGILTFDSASNQAVCAVMPRTDAVFREFLFWFLRYKRPEFLENSFGGAQPNISQSLLKRTLIPVPSKDIQLSIISFLEAVELRQSGNKETVLPELPFPLTKIRHFVARVDEVASKIEEARGLRRETVENDLPNLLNQSFKRIIQEATQKYKRVELQEVSHLITDGTHQTPQYVEEGMMFLSAKNIKPYKFMPEIHKYVSHEDYLGYTATRKAEKGDVLITRVGAGIGETAMIDRDLDFAFYVSLGLIKPNKELIYAPFLVHWLNSPEGFLQSKQKTLGRGNSQGNLNLNLLRKFSIPLPPIEEQKQIVAYLDGLQTKVEAVKKLQAETQAELDALLPSILDKAFKGEL